MQNLAVLYYVALISYVVWRNFVSRDETTIRFHIPTIIPSKAVARIKRNKKKEGEAVADWLTRCGELEIIYLISVVCRPQHAGLMFVE